MTVTDAEPITTFGPLPGKGPKVVIGSAYAVIIGDWHDKYNTVATDLTQMRALLRGPKAYRKCKCAFEQVDDESS